MLHAWREWTQTVPDEVTSAARIMQMPPIPEIPEPLRGRAFVTIDAAILGDRAFGAEIVQALRDLGPEIDTFDMVAPVALSRLHNDPEEPVPALTEHRLLSDLPAEAIDAIVAVAGPDSGSPLLAGRDPPPRRRAGRGAAGPRRAAALEAGYLVFGGGIAATPEMVAGLQAALPCSRTRWRSGTPAAATSTSRRTAPTHARSSTRSRTATCARIKAQVDPANIFRSNHPIAPAA